jgi:chaperonin cofactor prefoldin
MQNIYQLTEEMRYLADLIESGEAVDEDGVINEVVAEQIDFTKKALVEKGQGYVYVIKQITSELELYDKEIKRLKDRKETIENGLDRLKTSLSQAMILNGMTEIKCDTLKASFRKSESVEIIDFEKLPDNFKRTKIVMEADKIKIKEAIKNGEIVNGAEIVTNQNLQIK